MLLNVASKEGDTNNQSVSFKQIKQIRELIEQTQADKIKLLYHAGVDNLTDMSCETAQKILELLEIKVKQQRDEAQQFLPPQEQQKVV